MSSQSAYKNRKASMTLASQGFGRRHSTLDEALSAVRQLDAIVRNTFYDDAARLAGWTSARHVERTARAKKPSGEPAGEVKPIGPA